MSTSDQKKASKKEQPESTKTPPVEITDSKYEILLEKIEQLELDNRNFQKMLEQERSLREDAIEDEGEAILQLVEQLQDPFDDKNPFKIVGEIPPDVEHPEGQVVAWKNPILRNRGIVGWKGWKPICWDDEYAGKDGENLKNLIAEPPERYQGPDKIDNYVRRGDSVLCRLNKIYFKSRAKRRVLDSIINQKLASSAAKQVLTDGVELVGPGMTESKRPRDGKWKIGEIPPLAPGAVRTQLLKENRDVEE